MAPLVPLPFSDASLPLIRRLWREHIHLYRSVLLGAIFCMMIVAMGAAANAAMIKPILDKIFLEHRPDLLPIMIGVVLSIAATKGIAAYFQNVAMRYIGQRIIADLQLRLYRHLLYADLSEILRHSSGKLISRFTNDITTMREAVSSVLTGIARELLSVVFLIGVMVYHSPMLSFIALVVFPIAILPMMKLGRRMRRLAHKTQEELGDYTAQLDDTLLNIKTVKSYQREAFELERARTMIESIFQLYMKAAKTDALSSPVMESLSGVAVALVIGYGGAQVIAGHTTAGTFFTFIAALIMAYKPLKSLTDLNNHLQQGLAAAKRLFSLLDTAPQILNHPDAQPLQLTAGEIVFDRVSFFHQEKNPVLQEVSFTVPAGSFVAFVGGSGGGKTTLSQLLLRFYDITSGQITVDGQAIDRVTLESLREQLAIIPQEVGLFNDTIRANIAYGNLEATDAQVLEAASAAAAHGFIMECPEGYDTMIGQQGYRLSGGQRQRLAIARALLKNTPILILDEATSALDSLTERAIQASLQRVRRGRTTLVIAHRLSTIQDADAIYVLSEGQVVESGTHEALIAARGQYYQLYTKQQGDT